MGFLGRRRRAVELELSAGFWVSEASALQRTIASVPGISPSRTEALGVQLALEPGRDGRVAIFAHNRLVGFAPPDVAAELLQALSDATTGRLTTPGQIRRHGTLWRVWAGPAPAASAAWPDPPSDVLEPEGLRIFGIPLGERDGARSGEIRSDAAPRGSSAPGHPAKPVWTLRVGDDSWDLADGVDLDVERLRTRVLAAEPGARLHLRIWGDPVTIPVDGVTPVTLTPSDGSPAQQLQPRPAPLD